MLSWSNTRTRFLTCLPDIDEERLRIARDLHDGIAQDLVALGYVLDAAIGRSSTSEESRSDLRGIREELTRINSLVRSEIFSLRSNITIDLNSQLKEVLSRIFPNYHVVGELPPGDIGTELIKVLRELSLNARDHAHATTVRIRITPKDILMIHDGDMSPETETQSDIMKNDVGLGLIGIRERLSAHGADMKSDFLTRTTIINFDSSC